MTHAIATVLVPNDGSKSLEELMAPYDENIQMEPYDDECWCVDSARQVLINQELRTHFGGTFDEVVRKPFHDQHGSNYSKWQTFPPLVDYFTKEKELEATCPAQPPKPDCDECNGTGVVKSTYNPRSKWDWYQPIDVDRAPRAGDDFNGSRYDGHVKPGDVTYAIVLLDEGWQERGSLGWFGTSVDEKDDWDYLFKEVYTKYIETGLYTPVLVDYHI